MKLSPPVNENYCATVVRVRAINELANCDNVVGVPLFGMQAITGKDTAIGDLVVLFPTETQLSDEYCAKNNLFRHTEFNDNLEKKGYMEDNRRVKAMKFRGHTSNALVMSVDSLSYTGIAPSDLKEGDQFDKLGEHEVCKKYQIAIKHGRNSNQTRKIDQRVDGKFMPEQFDITNFLRVVDNVDQNAMCVTTQKLHGANFRVANTQVRLPKTWLDRARSLLGFRVTNRVRYDMVYGSHHVIKDANNPNQRHFYDFDLWSEVGHRFDGLLPKDYILWGEIVGWAGEKPIQRHYTYNQVAGTKEVYIYRVAIVNMDGVVADLSWDAVKEFCNNLGIKHVPELMRMSVGQLTSAASQYGTVLDEFMDIKYYDCPQKEYFADKPIPLAEDSPCDEGICIRIEGLQPQIYKVKSPLFLEHESKDLDTGESDIESADAILVEDLL